MSSVERRRQVAAKHQVVHFRVHMIVIRHFRCSAEPNTEESVRSGRLIGKRYMVQKQLRLREGQRREEDVAKTLSRNSWWRIHSYRSALAITLVRGKEEDFIFLDCSSQ